MFKHVQIQPKPVQIKLKPSQILLKCVHPLVKWPAIAVILLGSVMIYEYFSNWFKGDHTNILIVVPLSLQAHPHLSGFLPGLCLLCVL